MLNTLRIRETFNSWRAMKTRESVLESQGYKIVYEVFGDGWFALDYDVVVNERQVA